ncbi:MAG: FAD-dependent oxidoreductase [Oscillospiraceae bacterium]|nr:FAD-dependent oxidoreductase [Oscillospiraceae bacterium]
MKQEQLLTQLHGWYGDWFADDATMQQGRMNQNLHPYDNLFSSVQINKLTLKNRLVMAPIGNIQMCEETGRPNEKMIAYFAERAKGGVGLITTGLIPVTHNIDNTLTEKGDLSYFPRIDRSRTVCAGWRDLAQRCQSHGARVFVQLSAGLGRVGNPQCMLNKYKFPQSASLNPNFYIPQVPSLPLTNGQIRRMVKAMGQAAADAKACGLDGVYIHGHEGYLIEQLANTAFNRRKLGRYADWQRFGLDIVEEIRSRCGDDYPIMFRINSSLALNETYGDVMKSTHMKKFRKGRTMEETHEYLHNLVRAGVDAVDVDLGCYENWWLPHPPEGMPPGCFLAVAQACREYFTKHEVTSRAGLPVPVVAVGKLGYPDLAEHALQSGQCDMVMIGRPLLADPEWPNKVRAGRVGDITPCIGCQEGCINEFVNGGHPQCAVNPRTAFEEMLPAQLPKTDRPQKIAVVGGGPAGVTAAVIAAQRGHSVTLFEQNDRLGGKLEVASVPGIKFDLQNYLAWLRNHATKAAGEYDLTLKLNTEATAETLKDFDRVVLAAGARDINIGLPGRDRANIHQAAEVLQHPVKLQNASRVVVIGGGAVGCEVAYWLAKEHNKQVTVVEMQEAFMKQACTANRGYLLHYLAEAGVTLLNCTQLLSYQPNGITLRQNQHKSVPNPYVTWTPQLPENVPNPMAKPVREDLVDVFLPCDAVVIAAGSRAADALYQKLQRELPGMVIDHIGDGFAPGLVLQAVRSGYAVGSTL